jgi:hypothetical protein
VLPAVKSSHPVCVRAVTFFGSRLRTFSYALSAVVSCLVGDVHLGLREQAIDLLASA